MKVAEVLPVVAGFLIADIPIRFISSKRSSSFSSDRLSNIRTRAGPSLPSNLDISCSKASGGCPSSFYAVETFSAATLMMLVVKVLPSRSKT